ncbi:autoinducer binding domain-containing protein [Roseateles sp. P5_E1]
MKHSAANGELFSLAALAGAPDYGARILNILPELGDALTADVAVELFHQVLVLLGADAGVFMSFVRDDATRASYRSLLACDPMWASEYARRNWFERDPWLRHATHDTEPVLASRLLLLPAEEEFARTSATLGFASAVIAPAPTSAGSSRVGVLCLGSHSSCFFDDEGLRKIRVLARALAMELHRWLQNTIRNELLARSRVTAADLELLRHEEAGHSSKVIAAQMNIEPKTVDCRFQRISAKLDVPDRRTAARVARLYGLFDQPGTR